MKHSKIAIVSASLLIIILVIADTSSAEAARSGRHRRNSWRNYQSTAQGISPIIKPTPVAQVPTPEPEPTTPAPSGSLASSTEPQLRLLSKYEQLMGRPFADGMMLFRELPSSDGVALEEARDMALTLTEYAKQDIKPLVVIEPLTNHGQHFDLADIKNGRFDSALTAYFKRLKELGITDEQMGTWVLLPEPNVPAWGYGSQTDPELFAQNFNHLAHLLKASFPTARLSMLLNSQTYKTGDTHWSHPSYADLNPYVQNIDAGLADSFGLQGFPWAMRPADGAKYFDPAKFINPTLAANAAKALSVSKIWFNTGTFGALYAGSGDEVTITPNTRQNILDDISDQTKKLQSAGFEVSVNLFAEDKSNASEAADWSYLKQTQTKEVLKNSINKLTSSNVKITVFDE